jgi:DNA-binding MarR family transcriptional regulator
MSFEAMAWAQSVRIGEPLEKFVLLVLADTTGSDGTTKVSLSGIALKTDLSPADVRGIVRSLEHRGLIEKCTLVTGEPGVRLMGSF